MEKLFFSQQIIDSWCDDEKVRFANNKLTILTNQSTSFELTPAFRFMEVAGGEPDTHKLVGLIKTQKELEQMGADVYLDSCIMGEVPYNIEPGYVAQSDGTSNRSDEDLLTEFLLMNLL